MSCDQETATEVKESMVSSSGSDANYAEQSYMLDHSRSDSILAETAPAIALLERAALTNTGMHLSFSYSNRSLHCCEPHKSISLLLQVCLLSMESFGK